MIRHNFNWQPTNGIIYIHTEISTTNISVSMCFRWFFISLFIFKKYSGLVCLFIIKDELSFEVIINKINKIPTKNTIVQLLNE